MARGDVKAAGPTSVSNNAFLDIQAGSGEEWVIHNLYLPAFTNGYELHWYDGTTSEKIDTLSGSLYNAMAHVTNTRRLRVKNVSGVSQNLGFDGVQTR
jgi:hypothetical protein